MTFDDIYDEIDKVIEDVDGDTFKERFYNALGICLSENLPEESVYIINDQKYAKVMKMVSNILAEVKVRCEANNIPLPTVKFDASTMVLSTAMIVFGYKQGTLNGLTKDHLVKVFDGVLDDANIGIWIGNQSDLVMNIMIDDYLKSL